MPPVMAGRESEQAKLRTSLSTLQKRKNPKPFLLSAPRGMGKTALLTWVENQAAAKGLWTAVVSANQVETIPELVTLLAPKLLESKEITQSGQLRLGFAGGEVRRAETRTPSALAQELTQALYERTSDDPLVLAIDEAHTLSPPVVRTLVNIDQDLARKDGLVWIILAGTPGLGNHLRTAGEADPDSAHRDERISKTASFVERIEEICPLLLSHSAAREALLKPFEDRDWRVDLPVGENGDDALAPLIEEAQGYPFFLQLHGEAMWEAGADLGILDAGIVHAAREVVRVRREKFYHNRYQELLSYPEPGMVEAARAIARLFAGCKEASITKLYEVIRPHFSEHVATIRAFDFLVAQGFVWKPIGSRHIPGIPSLMDYVLEETPPRFVATGATRPD